MNLLGRKIITSLIVFFVALNLDFFLPRFAPGNAAEIFASGTRVPQQAVILLEQRFGLNQPLSVQYVDYLKNVFLSWPPYFGVSYEFYPTPVSNLIASRIPWTLLLISVSLFASIMLGYFFAGWAASRRGGKFEHGSVYTSIALFSTPPFWIAMVLIWVLAVTLKWFPTYGNIDFNPGTGLNYDYSILIHAVLPIIALTLVTFGQNYLILRGAVQEVLKSDFVTAGKMRGFKTTTISFQYVVKNSLLPYVSLLGYGVSTMISAVIVIEFVFGYQGLGDLIVDAIINRDYPVVEGSFFYVTLIVIAFTLLGDFLLYNLDPRVKQ
ncbi:MAG: ABC transporter permease [archaeon]|nr:ABC transporter permease [archaeon]